MLPVSFQFHLQYAAPVTELTLPFPFLFYLKSSFPFREPVLPLSFLGHVHSAAPWPFALVFSQWGLHNQEFETASATACRHHRLLTGFLTLEYHL